MHASSALSAQALLADRRPLLRRGAGAAGLPLGAQGLELGPREPVRGPEALERVVGDVREAVVQAEHILPPRLARELTQSRGPAFGEGFPCGALGVAEILVVGRVGEALKTVAGAEERRCH